MAEYQQHGNCEDFAEHKYFKPNHEYLLNVWISNQPLVNERGTSTTQRTPGEAVHERESKKAGQHSASLCEQPSLIFTETACCSSLFTQALEIPKLFMRLLRFAPSQHEPPFRRIAAAGGIAAAGTLLWAVSFGPLREALVIMDDPWLQAVAGKDSLFATDWPAWAWAANLGLLALLWVAHRTRMRRHDATAEDGALVWGASALVALFLVTLPLVAAGVSLAVQFQISRVFWLVDFLALVYVIGAVSGPRAATSRAAMVACALLALSIGRGAYVMQIEHPERSLFEVHLPDEPWDDAMRWLALQPSDVHVLADPGHAWKYGTSVRAAAGRDVFLEEVKDSALAIYSRDVAVRFVERVPLLADFPSLTEERARTLADSYDLDYLVTEADLALPAVYRNARFGVYSLR